jgi:hypothetical protein
VVYASGTAAEARATVYHGALAVSPDDPRRLDIEAPAAWASHIGLTVWGVGPGRATGGLWRSDNSLTSGLSLAMDGDGPFEGRIDGFVGHARAGIGVASYSRVAFPRNRDARGAPTLVFRAARAPDDAAASGVYTVGAVAVIAPNEAG